MLGLASECAKSPPTTLHLRPLACFRPAVRTAVAAFALAALVPPAARADWAYTTWGMTPEQVAGASNGTAKVLAKTQRTEDPETGYEIAAAGTATNGPADLVVSFLFEKRGGLQCVRMTPPPKNPTQNEIVKGMAVMQYGAPTRQTPHAGGETEVWQKPADVIIMDIIDGGTVAFVLDCQP